MILVAEISAGNSEVGVFGGLAMTGICFAEYEASQGTRLRTLRDGRRLLKIKSRAS